MVDIKNLPFISHLALPTKIPSGPGTLGRLIPHYLCKDTKKKDIILHVHYGYAHPIPFGS
ncbi:hypothetical protein BH18THE1_BH18THE1_03180 [soil metagenome]